MEAVKDPRSHFDWLAFATREAVAVALPVLWIVRGGGRTDSFLLGGIGLAVLTALNYFQTSYGRKR